MPRSSAKAAQDDGKRGLRGGAQACGSSESVAGSAGDGAGATMQMVTSRGHGDSTTGVRQRALGSSGAQATTNWTPEVGPPLNRVNGRGSPRRRRGAGISGSDWSVADAKKFEAVYARYLNEEVTEKLWIKVAGQIPGKSVDQVVKYYRALADELRRIDAGEVPLPRYKAENGETPAAAGPTGKGAKSGTDQERRKGIPWSEEEHRLFLMGLTKFGKGDWRSISRNFVISRTPTQVASHAQKYFIRLNSLNKKDKRRSSIHDITSVQNTQTHSSVAPQFAGGMYPAPMGGMHPSQHAPVGGGSQYVYH